MAFRRLPSPLLVRQRRTFDVVGVTWMTVQKVRMREILLKLRELGLFTVVGGPYCSSLVLQLPLSVCSRSISSGE